MRFAVATSLFLTTLAIASPVPVDDTKPTIDDLKNLGSPSTGVANTQKHPKVLDSRQISDLDRASATQDIPDPIKFPSPLARGKGRGKGRNNGSLKGKGKGKKESDGRTKHNPKLPEMPELTESLDIGSVNIPNTKSAPSAADAAKLPRSGYRPKPGPMPMPVRPDGYRWPLPKNPLAPNTGSTNTGGRRALSDKGPIDTVVNEGTDRAGLPIFDAPSSESSPLDP